MWSQGQILTHSVVLKTQLLSQKREVLAISEYFALEISGKPLGAAATRDKAAKGQPEANDNCMVASEKPEEMRSREIGRTLVNKGNWNYLQGWNKDKSHFPCVWLLWWPAHLGHMPFHLATFYRQPAACILKISIAEEQLFLQQQSWELPQASLLRAHLVCACPDTAGSSLGSIFTGQCQGGARVRKPSSTARVRLCTTYLAKGGRGNYREEGTGFHSPALPACIDLMLDIRALFEQLCASAL